MSITINGTGSITGLTAGGLPDGSITTDDIAANAVTAAKLAAGAGGKILQVQTSLYTTTNSISLSTAMVQYDLPFSVNITPLSASSKILISFSVMGEHDSSPWNTTAAFSRTISGTRTVVSATGVSNRNPGLIVPGDTYGSGGDNDSTPLQFVLSNYPDLPSTTSTITYTPTVNHNAGGRTFYLNRVVVDVDDAGRERCHSWITAMEVAA